MVHVVENKWHPDNIVHNTVYISAARRHSVCVKKGWLAAYRLTSIATIRDVPTRVYVLVAEALMQLM